MGNYTKAVDFAAKDALLAGNPAKLGKGTEVDTEFNNIAVAIATKVDSGGALGTPSSGTLTNCTGLPQAGTVGLTTADSPQFSGVNIGHASDTTLTRAAAGTLAVEGVNLLTTSTGAALAGSASQAFSASNFTTAQGIQFPATQNPSSDPNTLDDYEEGTWTPTLTFSTPGNLSVTYASRLGRYTKIGRVVHISFVVYTSTFTHTTAVGELVFTGLPFIAANQSDSGGGALILFTGITKAGYSQYTIRPDQNSAQARIFASGSSSTANFVLAADCPTGTTKEFYGEFTYQI